MPFKRFTNAAIAKLFTIMAFFYQDSFSNKCLDKTTEIMLKKINREESTSLTKQQKQKTVKKKNK